MFVGLGVIVVTEVVYVEKSDDVVEEGAVVDGIEVVYELLLVVIVEDSNFVEVEVDELDEKV